MNLFMTCCICVHISEKMVDGNIESNEFHQYWPVLTCSDPQRLKNFRSYEKA